MQMSSNKNSIALTKRISVASLFFTEHIYREFRSGRECL